MSKVEAYIRRLEKELLAQPIHRKLFTNINDQLLPSKPCVYLLWKHQQIQCIGQSTNLKTTYAMICNMGISIPSNKKKFVTNLRFKQIPHLDLSYHIIRIGRQELVDHLTSIYHPLYYFKELPSSPTSVYYYITKSKYKNAYQKWTEEEEMLLVNELTQVTSIAVVAEKLCRNRGAIYARIRKLGLIPYAQLLQKGN